MIVLLSIIVLGAVVWFSFSPEVQKIDKSLLERRKGIWCVKDSGLPFTGMMQEFQLDDPKQLLSEIPLEKGLAHGFARAWYPSGQLEMEEPFVNGKSHGTRTRYHENGKVRSVATIVQGVLHGPFSEYYDNGQLAVEMTLQNGIGQGESRAWHRSGKLKAVVTLKDGEAVVSEYFEDR
jgi:antitoxin component YwqK of YwqJK toxin-antitoxin module